MRLRPLVVRTPTQKAELAIPTRGSLIPALIQAKGA